jgi:hypothetical protein
MAETAVSAGREVGATILRFMRPSGSAGNSDVAALRAEVDGLRLALTLAQEALREERCDKEHWREEAKQLRELLAAPKREPQVILAEPETVSSSASPEPSAVVEAPALAPVGETGPDRVSTATAPEQSAAGGSPSRWWEKLFA